MVYDNWRRSWALARLTRFQDSEISKKISQHKITNTSHFQLSAKNSTMALQTSPHNHSNNRKLIRIKHMIFLDSALLLVYLVCHLLLLVNMGIDKGGKLHWKGLNLNACELTCIIQKGILSNRPSQLRIDVDLLNMPTLYSAVLQ